ncbi:MAG: glycerol-3-phosphate acyltransferase [Chloroflexi bacterium]|nr:glycerol-3-phosphate acyltransferase [Chloroflexota bacterium]MQC27144.1 glycerol-3-phosphate acyltransferase [Chloroflexota bacterium]
MEFWRALSTIGLAYLLGAVPFGFILVMWRTGKDIRDVQSGRTGGTNAMRAAGFTTGFTTGALDVFKGFFAVSLAKALMPGNEWIAAIAPAAAILGHNYSISLIKVDKEGKLRFGGGAGGATVLGGAMGLWTPALWIMLPLGILIYYFIGYASITTTSAGIAALIIFAVRAYLGLSPWEYFLFGVLATVLVVIALKPNYRALRAGTERLHGYRARKLKKAEK